MFEELSESKVEANVNEAKKTFSLHDSSQPLEKRAQPQPDVCSVDKASPIKVSLERTDVLDKMSVVAISEIWQNYELEWNKNNEFLDPILTDTPLRQAPFSISSNRRSAFFCKKKFQTNVQHTKLMLKTGGHIRIFIDAFT